MLTKNELELLTSEEKILYNNVVSSIQDDCCIDLNQPNSDVEDLVLLIKSLLKERKKVNKVRKYITFPQTGDEFISKNGRKWSVIIMGYPIFIICEFREGFWVERVRMTNWDEKLGILTSDKDFELKPCVTKREAEIYGGKYGYPYLRKIEK
jgi:hypothetical protein